MIFGAFEGVGRAQGDKPFSKRGTPAEREEKLSKAIRAIAQYSFNYSSDSLECARLANKLLEDRPKEIDKIDMGKLLPQAAQTVAKQFPKSWFFFHLPTAEHDTSMKKATDLLGKEDRTEKDTIAYAGGDVPITWYFYGWCGFGVAKNGKVYAIKVECKDVLAKKDK
jgi:hypothetical protein